MNKKGFTLVEVLLVIVIIGVIGVITIPNILDSLQASREKNGKAVEDLLVNNLELYNEDHKIDIWDSENNDIGYCKRVTYGDLKAFNQNINLGECKVVNDTLVIQRTAANKFKYFVNITCSKKINNVNDTYYNSNNKYSCLNWVQ